MKHEPLTNKGVLGILYSINGHKKFEQHPSRADDKSYMCISLQVFPGLNYTGCILALRGNLLGSTLKLTMSLIPTKREIY